LDKRFFVYSATSHVFARCEKVLMDVLKKFK